MAMPTLQQIIGTITGKVAFERTQANFTTIKTTHDALETNLTSHKAESASKHITESGTNPNGSYIKFDDGTMICNLNTTVLVPANSTSNKIWTFSSTFTSLPTVIPNLGYDGSIKIRAHTGQVATANAVIRATDESGTERTLNLYLIAIGRWK